MSFQNYIVKLTDCTPLQSHLTGCLIYSPIGNISRPTLLGRTSGSQGSPSHRAPQVRPRPCGLDQPSCTASSPWPRPLWRLDGRPISSTDGDAAVLPEASQQALQDPRVGRRTAIRPEQCCSSPAEYVRAVAAAREEGNPWNQAFPPPDDP